MLYLAIADGLGVFKLGYTQQPEVRFPALRNACPVELVFEAYPGTAYHESLLHARLKKYRLHGEWFRLSPRQLEKLREVMGKLPPIRPQVEPSYVSPKFVSELYDIPVHRVYRAVANGRVRSVKAAGGHGVLIEAGSLQRKNFTRR